MNKELIYFDTNLLQKDMRVRLPKAILANLNVEAGTTNFHIFLDTDNDQIVLKKVTDTDDK